MRLIDADALKKAIEQGEGFSWDSHGKDDLCVRKKYIDNAPTVAESCKKLQEVANERPQGKWEEDWREDLDSMSRKGWKCLSKTSVSCSDSSR